MRAAKITDFRIHDLRHDFASKLLRATRDLKLVQDTLLHSDISTTIRYTHVMDEDVRAGLDAMPSRNSGNSRRAEEKVRITIKDLGNVAPGLPKQMRYQAALYPDDWISAVYPASALSVKRERHIYNRGASLA